MKVPPLNFIGGPGISLLNFEGGPGVLGPGILVPLLHHAMYLKCPNEFRMSVICLGGFHIAKCVQHCIGKYIRGSGLDDPFVET